MDVELKWDLRHAYTGIDPSHEKRDSPLKITCNIAVPLETESRIDIDINSLDKKPGELPSRCRDCNHAATTPQAKPAPDLKIPHSKHTVDVSIIDTTAHVKNIPVPTFTTPSIPGYNMVDACVYAFSIKRSNADVPNKYGHLIFDLGVRKDYENAPPAIVARAKEGGFEINVEKDVVDILKDNGDDAAKVGGIIWSHNHFDHTGAPETFLKSTDLIVGPGFKKANVPAYPTVEDAQLDERAWQGRNLREIDFEKEGKGLMLGQYRAMDFFGDGSFYLVDSPGHTSDHTCGLAKTSADPPEFIIMGGDIAHQGGEFRPTQWLPLPEDVQPNPMIAPYAKSTVVCPGHVFEAIHPNKSSTEPFMKPNGFIHFDAEQAVQCLAYFEEFDAQDNIFAVIARYVLV